MEPVAKDLTLRSRHPGRAVGRSPRVRGGATGLSPVEGRSERAIRRPGVVEVRDPAQLEAYRCEWEGLAAAALEPNVFHEPWMMLPAIRSYGGGRDLRFVLVFTPGDPPTGPAVLSGFFPLERRRAYQRIPVPTLSLWRYPHCFLGTPLVRRDAAEECLESFFDWAARDVSTTLLELGRVSGEGRFFRLVHDQISKRGMFAFSSESYLRALFTPAEDAEAYLRNALTGKKRKELRRQASRLAELGRLDFDELEDASELEAWIDEFLRLEASGWKGAQGTALASTAEDSLFFREIAREAFRRGCLSMLALRLDGEAHAMKFNLDAGDGAFAIKVAMNERFARFSPGVLLEVEGIRRLHARDCVRWVDSCAEPNHPMIDHLWTDRRLIQSVVVATRAGGDFLVSVLPLLRWLRWKLLPGGPLAAHNGTMVGGQR